MDTTLLKGTQMLCMDKQEDMLNLYDECCKSGLIKQQDTAGFYKTLQKFHCEIKKYSDFEETICRPDKDGYYKTEITAVREVPDGYRCYRFKGLLEQQDAYKEDETHWLFYKKGEFRELSVGDFVRFKVKTTKLRQFWDLKNARNIYPLVLERVE